MYDLFPPGQRRGIYFAKFVRSLCYDFLQCTSILLCLYIYIYMPFRWTFQTHIQREKFQQNLSTVPNELSSIHRRGDKSEFCRSGCKKENVNAHSTPCTFCLVLIHGTVCGNRQPPEPIFMYRSPPPFPSHFPLPSQLVTNSLTPTILAVADAVPTVPLLVAPTVAVAVACTPPTLASGPMAPFMTIPCTLSYSTQSNCLAPGSPATVMKCSTPLSPAASWL